MTIIAKIVEHSISAAGKELVTYALTYPRFIHAEAKTHRVLSSNDNMVELLEEVSLMDDRNLSRNASSSRAIPVLKMIERTLADPARFVYVGKNQAGMQAKEEVDGVAREQFEREWIELGNIVADYSRRWATELNVHKQTANRALEAWQHITVVVTATEWDNFFALRDHPDAQPEIRELAHQMKLALEASTPVVRGTDPTLSANWHLPFISQAEREQYPTGPRYLAKLSTARCARTSYLNHDGSNPDVAKDVQLYKDLVGAEPLHASPTEHQGYPFGDADRACKNFRGWFQFRELVEAEIYA